MSSSDPGAYLDFDVVLKNLEHIVVIGFLYMYGVAKSGNVSSASLLVRTVSSASFASADSVLEVTRPTRAAAKPAKTCGAMRAAAAARVRVCGTCGTWGGQPPPAPLE